VGIKRKQHGAEFKARVAMAALSGEKTLTELSAEFGVHPTMIGNWKQELVTRAGELFARGSKAPAGEDAQKVIEICTARSGSCRSSAIFLPDSPPSPDWCEAGDDRAESGDRPGLGGVLDMRHHDPLRAAIENPRHVVWVVRGDPGDAATHTPAAVSSEVGLCSRSI
jgi:transposase